MGTKFSFFSNVRKILHNVLHLQRIVGQTIQWENELALRKMQATIAVAEMNRLTRECKEMGISTEKYGDHELTVSLTTYGKRIYDAYLTIESLMQQTIKPNKIVLWLAEDEFTLENIPQTLKNLQKRGLTIEFCEDIKSYKKLVPALKKYPNDIIITVDDDIIYQFDLVENLLNSYKQNPELIHFCRGHRINFKDDNNLSSYMNWYFYISDYEINALNFPTGVGGVLYPPHCLHEEVVNESMFMALAPAADDVWFFAMACKNGTLSRKCYTHNYYGDTVDYIDIDFEAQRESALFNANITRNDAQIQAVFEKYGIYELLK